MKTNPIHPQNATLCIVCSLQSVGGHTLSDDSRYLIAHWDLVHIPNHLQEHLHGIETQYISTIHEILVKYLYTDKPVFLMSRN